jgi:hypothetical protein
MFDLMNKDVFDSWLLLKARLTKLRPSRLEQIHLPSVFHKEEDNVLKENKVDETMFVHLVTTGPTHSQKTQDYHLM